MAREGLAGPGVAAVAVLGEAVVDAVGQAAAREVVLAVVEGQASGTTLPSASRYSTSSTTLTCQHLTER